MNSIKANKLTATHTLAHTLSRKASIAVNGIKIDTVMSPLTSEIKLHGGQLGGAGWSVNWIPGLTAERGARSYK